MTLKPLPDRPWLVLPGDEIRVRVYREPELNGQWLVNGKGEVIVPGLGRISAAGMTVDSLGEVITSGYSKRIVDAIVDVGIIRTIPVLGGVKVPALYQIEPSMTLQQVIGKAGGIRGTSLKTPSVLLQKGRDGTRYALAVDVRLDRVPLDEGDAIIVIDPSFLERWSPWMGAIYSVGIVITVISSVLVIFKR